MKKINIIKIVFLILLVPISAGVFFPGYTALMLEHGWDIEFTVLSSQSLEGYSPPVAKKNSEGNLVFQCFGRVNQLGIVGDIIDTQRVAEIKKKTYLILKDSLQDYEIALSHGAVSSKIYTWKIEDAGGLAFENVPNMEIAVKDEHFILPEVESIIWINDYYWYIPATKLGEKPRMAIIKTEEYETPWTAYVKRGVALPFTLFIDGIVWPVYRILVYAGIAEAI